METLLDSAHYFGLCYLSVKFITQGKRKRATALITVAYQACLSRYGLSVDAGLPIGPPGNARPDSLKT